jgi:cytoskeletal protein RodZ
MADESSSTAGKRFSEDLRHIREKQDLSVSEIHHETQIPETLIESFEAGRLYDHPSYNRVYLRSFVKAYADAVRIQREMALECLDAALEGTYEDALASTYLTDRSGPDASSEDAPPEPSDGGAPSRESRDPADTPEAPTAGGPEGRGGIVGPPRAVGEDPPAEAEPNLPDSPIEDSPPPPREGQSDRSSSDSSAPDGSSAGSTPPPDEAGDDPEAASPTPEPSDPVPDASDSTDAPDTSSDATDPDAADDPSATGNSPAWMEEEAEESSNTDRPASSPAGGEEEPALGAGQGGIVGEPSELGSGPSGDAPSAAQAGRTPSRSGPGASRSESNGWASLLNDLPQHYVTGAGIVVVLLVLVGLGIAYVSSDETEQSTPAATGPPDTTVAAGPADTETATPQRPPADVRLGSTIHLTVLATDTVSALRIERDEDLRRPYWIVEGEAEVFPFQERVTVENELPNVRLFVEGYPYPVQPEDTSEGLELTRSGLQSFVDTLRGAPPSLSVSPDTIPVGPPPQ